MRHVRRPLRAEAERDQLVVRPERAVEEDAGRALERVEYGGRHGRDAGEVSKHLARRAFEDAEADIVFAIGREAPHQVNRRLAGQRHRGDREPARRAARAGQLLRAAGRQRAPDDLPLETLERPVEHVAVDEAAADAVGGVHRYRVRLAQREQPEAVIEVAVGEQDARDRASRAAPRGCNAVKLSIWARISGEALSRNHASPSALTATLSCVRGTAAIAPARTPRQFGQPQFHCGKPPPAADPSTLTRTVARSDRQK